MFGNGVGVVLGVALVEVPDIVGSIRATVDHFTVGQAFGELAVGGQTRDSGHGTMDPEEFDVAHAAGVYFPLDLVVIGPRG